MAFKSAYKKISIKELVILLVILFCGALYVFYIWIDTKNQNVNQVLQVSSSVVASLPKEELKYLDQKPEELKDDQFLQLKESLQKVIAVNKDARFAYLYIERDNKLYFVVDSEPLNSPDYSPAGQEFTEADPVDKKPFTERKPIITQPVTDRWGTWVSVEIPVINEATGKVVAAFGMDYNSRAWGNRILFEVSESSLLVIIILILALVTRRSYHKNFLLEKEITQRIKAEKGLKENEVALSNLISNLPGMVYRCKLDEDYTMDFMSEACSRITGYAPEDFIGNKLISFNDLIYPEYRQPIWDQWQKVLADKSVFESEYPIKTATGETKWVWERGRCILDEKGQVQFLEGYIDDITDKKINETELIRAKEKAEESERLKSVFLANISHEIRTPMNGILGFAELLKEPDLSPENHQEFISTIEVNLYRMLNIISDLIEISKIEAGEMILKTSNTNVNTLLYRLHDEFKTKINGKNIQLDFHCGLPDEQSIMATDSGKLNQILSKLIKNAIKFTEEGKVSFGYNKKEQGLEFFVSDTGPGIQPHVKDMIFERFMQVDQGSTRKYEGIGLGLTISKAYVEQLGGTIKVESEPGKGSTFLFELPFEAIKNNLVL
jgi:PAS domain S-box-containing protein